jgi:hypothetical protein
MKDLKLGNCGRGAALLAALILSGATLSPTLAKGGDQGIDADTVRRGFDIAPVPLNRKGKDRDLVGLGSYLVNAVASCNDCHSAGPAVEFAPGGNPYFKGSPPTVVNQSVYLGGGHNFGALVPGTPEIVSRNLTPDRTGRPVGGLTLAQFEHILRTGEDLDHLHPNCSATVTANCFPAALPFNGDLLQIMPWPILQNLTHRDVRAIYEYLSAIPCIAGPATGVLHNDCI